MFEENSAESKSNSVKNKNVLAYSRNAELMKTSTNIDSNTSDLRKSN